MKSLCIRLVTAFLLCWALPALSSPPPGPMRAARLPYVPGEVIVKFRQPLTAQAKSAQLLASGQALDHVESLAYQEDLWRIGSAGAAKSSGPELQALMARTAQIVDELKRRSDVEYAHPNYYMELFAAPYDPFYPQQWNLTKINASQAWDYGWGKTIVAVIDTGRLDHQDLASQWLPGYDFGDNDADPYDNGIWHHGTHVAGIVAALANRNNPNNTEGTAGLCPGCQILPVKISTASGSITSARVPQAIDWAVARGARVINMSFGTVAPSVKNCAQDDPALQAAVTNAIAKGTVVVAAAGNDSRDTGLVSPANCAGVVAVSASDRNDALALYSNRGARTDLLAPGGGGQVSDNSMYGNAVGCSATPPGKPYQGTAGVLSSWAVERNRSQLTAGEYCYRYLSGTSMAAPHVAATAALILSKNPALTPARVVQILKQSAHPVAGCASTVCGAGRLDAGSAVKMTPLPAVTFNIAPSALVVPINAATADFRIDWNAPGYTALDWWGSVNGSTPAYGVSTAASGNTVQPLAPDTTYQYWVYPNGTSSPLLSRASVVGKRMDFIARPNPVVVPAGQSQGNVNLAWSAPGYDDLRWCGFIDGVGNGCTLITPGTGTVSMPVPVGKTYRFTVHPSNDQSKTLADVTITARY